MTIQYVDGNTLQKLEKSMDKEIMSAIKMERHYWISIQTHHVSLRMLDRAMVEPMLLDNESLRGMYVGCYICETEWTPEKTRRKCPGPPKDAVNQGWLENLGK